MFGTQDYLDANYALQLERYPDAVIRFTEGTDIAGIISGIDPRVPATVEDYDLKYGTAAD